MSINFTDKVRFYEKVSNSVQLEKLVDAGFVPAALRDAILDDRKVYFRGYSEYHFIFPVEITVGEGEAWYTILTEGEKNG